MARNKDIKSGRYDGVHMYGPSGQKAYTDSVLKILSSAQLVRVNPPKYEKYDHQTCSQVRYQAKHMDRRNQTKTKKNNLNSSNTGGDYQYAVPTQNRYTTLGDYFPKN